MYYVFGSNFWGTDDRFCLWIHDGGSLHRIIQYVCLLVAFKHTASRKVIMAKEDPGCFSVLGGLVFNLIAGFLLGVMFGGVAAVILPPWVSLLIAVIFG